MAGQGSLSIPSTLIPVRGGENDPERESSKRQPKKHEWATPGGMTLIH